MSNTGIHIKAFRGRRIWVASNFKMLLRKPSFDVKSRAVPFPNVPGHIRPCIHRALDLGPIRFRRIRIFQQASHQPPMCIVQVKQLPC